LLKIIIIIIIILKRSWAIKSLLKPRPHDFVLKTENHPTLVETWKYNNFLQSHIFLAQVSCIVIPGVSWATHCKYLHMHMFQLPFQMHVTSI
jgi:hypothetical protein